MKRRRLLGILIALFIVIVAAVAGGLFLYSQQLYRDSYGSDYTYEVRLSPSAPITNVTILVPPPSQNGNSLVTASTIAHPFTPSGWRYDVTDTEYGPMVRIEADEIPTDPTYHYSVIRDDRLVRWETIPQEQYNPENDSHLRVQHDDIEIDVAVESERTIDTRAPIDSEPLLRPQTNRTETACFMPHDREETCYTYTGRIFVSYDAVPDTTVYISIELRGTNSWWVFGWNFNEYTDRQTVELTGPQDGWIPTEGQLETGQGNYRDPPR